MSAPERIWLKAREGDSFFAPGADVFPYSGKTGNTYLLTREEYDAVMSCRTPARPLVGPSRIDGTRVMGPMCFLENYDRHVEYTAPADSEADVLFARIVQLEKKQAEWEALEDVSTQVVPSDGHGLEVGPTPKSIREHLAYLQDEWDAAERREGALRRAAKAVTDAWEVTGPSPATHYRALYRKWPTLAKALAELVTIQKS